MAGFRLRAVSGLLTTTLLLAACTGGGPATPPVEQLPNPDFEKKPQLFFVVDDTSRFWNLPHPAELELKHRVRLTLAHSAELASLENSLRDFNSRGGDLLLFSGERLVPSAKNLALFSHPSGRRSYNVSLVSDASLPQIHIDFATARTLIESVCARWKKELGSACAWDPALGGAMRPLPSSPSQDGIAVGFQPSETANFLKLRIDWVQWTEQFLRSLAHPSQQHSAWQKIDLASGTLLLELGGPDASKLEELRRILQEERMKRL